MMQEVSSQSCDAGRREQPIMWCQKKEQEEASLGAGAQIAERRWLGFRPCPVAAESVDELVLQSAWGSILTQILGLYNHPPSPAPCISTFTSKIPHKAMPSPSLCDPVTTHNAPFRALLLFPRWTESTYQKNLHTTYLSSWHLLELCNEGSDSCSELHALILATHLEEYFAQSKFSDMSHCHSCTSTSM